MRFRVRHKTLLIEDFVMDAVDGRWQATVRWVDSYHMKLTVGMAMDGLRDVIDYMVARGPGNDSL